MEALIGNEANPRSVREVKGQALKLPPDGERAAQIAIEVLTAADQRTRTDQVPAGVGRAGLVSMETDGFRGELGAGAKAWRRA